MKVIVIEGDAIRPHDWPWTGDVKVIDEPTFRVFLVDADTVVIKYKDKK